MEEKHEEVLYRRDDIKKTFEQILREFDDQHCCVLDNTSEHIANAVIDLVTRMIETGLQMEIIEVSQSGTREKIKRFGHIYKDIFTNSRLIPVGSFAEGTKTSDPDEFDFLFQFSLKDAIFVKGCHADKLKILLEGQKPWQTFLKDNWNLDTIDYTIVRHLFRNMLRLVERQITKKAISVDVSLVSGTLKFISLSDQGLVLELIPRENSESGNLDSSRYFAGAILDGTTETTNLQRKNKSEALNIITVDIMPAIDCPFDKLKQFVMKFKFPEEIIPIAQEENTCLVPKSCKRQCPNCFQISFAKIETRLIKDMDNNHKACYRILKKTFPRPQTYPIKSEYTDITSYKLKNAILYQFMV